jgi:tRNA threonylcarbamoyladenosine biosynthesis protein TsaB
VIILTLRTDKPIAELRLYEDKRLLSKTSWTAHRILADTIHLKMDKMLNKSSISLADIEGLVVYSGPGSFTGLRIGASVANSLAYGLGIPLVAVTGENWPASGLASLMAGRDDKTVHPKYGFSANITKPRK